MYLDYFGLKETPFAIAPDPRYLFMSEQHREALAHLLYGVRSNGGFVLLTGEVGTGKTTVCRCFLGQIPDDCQVAFILNPRLTARELLEAICDEFRISVDRTNANTKHLVDRINRFLLDAHAAARNPVLIIDEAQNLSFEVLEQIRLLTNLETDQRKLLQVVLLGQPELRDMLRRKELRQLSQRITARFHLDALNRDDVVRYVQHRLTVAGRSAPLFPARLFGRIHRLTGGIPRLVNLVCDRALLGASVEGTSQVSRRILDKAAREVLDEQRSAPQARFLPVAAAVLFGVLLLAGGLAAFGLFPIEWPSSVASLNPAQNVEPSPLPPEPSSGDAVAADPPRPPVEMPVQADVDSALRDLATSWDIPLPEAGADMCREVALQGLACYESRGSLESLRRLDLPAVLTLVLPGGGPGYVPLVGLKSDLGLVKSGEQLVEVSRQQLEKDWLGSFVLLWQPPQAYHRDLPPGAKDALVGWVAKQLQVTGFLVADVKADVLEGEVLEAVRRFQADSGLPDDGIVGPWTLILLANRAGLPGPRLLIEGRAG